jgi:hypothetical protein
MNWEDVFQCQNVILLCIKMIDVNRNWTEVCARQSGLEVCRKLEVFAMHSQ